MTDRMGGIQRIHLVGIGGVGMGGTRLSLGASVFGQSHECAVIRKKSAELLSQTLRGELALGDDDPGAARGEARRVLQLVIIDGMRKRNQDGANPRCREFRNG